MIARKRLAYLSGSTIPSSSANSVHVMKQCQALARADIDVTLFAKTGTAEEPFGFYGVEENFTLERSINLGIPKVGGAVRSAQTLFNLRRAGAFDIVYGRDILLIMAAAKMGNKVALELHQIPTSSRERKTLRTLIKHENFQGLVVISKGLQEDVFKFLDQRPRTLIAHDGADIPPKSKAMNLGKAPAHIGYTGSLHMGKGVELIVEIAAIAADYKFHIVGGNDLQIEFWQEKAPKNVIFHGHQPHKSLAAYLMAFDIVLAPYQNKATIKSGADISRWISPLKLFEYMAAQKPILCSDLEVIREVLRDGENAMLLPSDAPEKWAQAIEILNKDQALKNALTKTAYKDFTENYTWCERAKNILEFISK